MYGRSLIKSTKAFDLTVHKEDNGQTLKEQIQTAGTRNGLRIAKDGQETDTFLFENLNLELIR